MPLPGDVGAAAVTRACCVQRRGADHWVGNIYSDATQLCSAGQTWNLQFAAL